MRRICKVTREMSTATLPSEARRNVALFTLASDLSAQPKMRFVKVRNSAGQDVDALVVEGVPVFRSGTFRDSMGFQHTWEGLHMDQMVAHFDMLKNRGIFADVPIRKGHGALFGDPIDGVIGYHTALRTEKRTSPVDGKEYDYLLADYEILDSDAINKISSKLWRNVSAEVGPFLTNDEAEFWPVYQGVAYVDIPAVEGLKQFSKANGVGEKFSVFMLDDKKEAPVGTEDNNGQQGTTPPPVQPQFDAAQFARANFQFTIGGRQTQDFAAVQAHITGLETAQAEVKNSNRSAFIKGLADGAAPKILASQIEGIELYAMKLDDESWSAFEKSWGTAPSTPVTGNHGQSTPQGQALPPASTPEGSAPQGTDEVTTLEDIIAHHKRSNMPRAALESTKSFQRLKALKPDSSALA